MSLIIIVHKTVTTLRLIFYSGSSDIARKKKRKEKMYFCSEVKSVP